MKNYMKEGVNSIARLPFVFLFGLMCFIPLYFSSCSDSLDEKEPQLQYGALEIASGGERALEIDKIKYAEVCVTGTNIKSPLKSEEAVSGGTGNITISNIPVGKNRIVTVYAKDSSASTIYGVTLRAVVDIKAGETATVSVNWTTTALGNVFNELNLLGVDLQAVDSSKISNCIDPSKHALLINAAKIASDYKQNSLKSAADYVMTPATAKVNFTQAEGKFTVQVCDPISSVTTGVNGVTNVTNIAPGTWDVVLLDASGSEIKRKTLNTFTSGGTVDIDMNDKVWTDIVVHAKAMYVWYWPTGVAGKCAKMQEETGGWYGYVFKDVSELNVIFGNSNFGNNDWSGKISDDLFINKSGEYWCVNGKLQESNPEDTQKPILTSFVADKNGTVSEVVVFTISATDNSGLSKAEIFVDEKSIAFVTLSGTNASASYSWNSAAYKNGSHTVSAVVYDGAGNGSEKKSISFTTNNVNLPPVAVITGSSVAIISSSKTYSATSSYDQTIGGQIKSYSWKVTGGATPSSGSGESITLKMPSSPTSITITLVVTDEEGATAKTEKTVKINEAAESTDFREESIYFLMTTRFYDGDKSNNEYCWDEGGEYLPYGSAADCGWRGDFKGLIEKLDYIKALGFSAIWITPVVVNASGIDYHGYHAMDFSKVDPRYESSGVTYQTLIDACHEKGLKVIQDIVLNHTGNFGENNIFHMFNKDTPYQADANAATPPGSWKKSTFVSPATTGGYGYDCLVKGADMAGGSYASLIPDSQYAARINAMKEDSIDTKLIYHHTKMIDWNSINCQLGQMAGDCVDLNTENPEVIKYLIDCYSSYINMGVDAFRIDTVKHISRLMFNKYYNPAFMQAAKDMGNNNFYMFGEVCARYRGRWNENVPALSPSFYTWKETDAPYTGESLNSYGTEAQNTADATSHFTKYASSFTPPAPQISNTKLKGNDYHTLDYKNRSDLGVIDFGMHWAFKSTNDAFNTALSYDDDYSDATWNVTYVDSHDYAPDSAPENKRFDGNWPDKLNLLFTFRGIPCIYYGTEIEFQKGLAIDPANERIPLEKSGRAYFGDHLEGSVSASDFGTYTASGAVAQTLDHDLAQHIIRLNQIRRAIPALQKGQYSTEGCSGGISFKRRYTDSEVDSFALVAINGQATFSNVPSGTYVEVITGKTVDCGGTLKTDAIGENNMRVYVLQTGKGDIPSGKIGKDGAYLK